MKKKLCTTYLYADGHAVQIFEKFDREAGIHYEFAEVTEKFTDAICTFEGRILVDRFNDGLTHLLKIAEEIHAILPSIDNGSDKSKAAGVEVGTLSLLIKGRPVSFMDIPTMIRGIYVHQHRADGTFAETIAHCNWGNARIAKIHRVKTTEVAVAS